MKKTIEKQRKTGSIILYAFLILTAAYIVYTVIFYIDQFFNPALTLLPSQPLVLYITKWIYALTLIIGVIWLSRKPKSSYLLINTASISIILFWGLCNTIFVYYVSGIDNFLLEFVALGFVIVTNLRHFIKQHGIRRKLSDLVYTIVLPIILTVGVYYLLEFLLENNITWLLWLN